jgi:hypothetical protein
VLDAMFPGKLVAVRPTYLETGEWFYVPTTKAGGAPGTNGSFPWNSDLFFYGDYSVEAHAEFCAWPGLPPALQTNCSIPTAAVRLAANLGNTFVEGADAESARAILFTRFLAVRVATAIIALAQVIKDVSGGKLLSMFFYGYLFELGWDVTAGHHALGLLLNAPEIDILSAPYSYGISRTVSVGFQPHGPADSLTTAGKLFVHEDDTRTCLCGAEPACTSDSFWKAHNLSDSVALIRRNGLTAMLRGNGLYYFDLYGYGWFGRPDSRGTSEALWRAVSSVVEAAQRLDHSQPTAFLPQVLVVLRRSTAPVLHALHRAA